MSSLDYDGINDGLHQYTLHWHPRFYFLLAALLTASECMHHTVQYMHQVSP